MKSIRKIIFGPILYRLLLISLLLFIVFVPAFLFFKISWLLVFIPIVYGFVFIPMWRQYTNEIRFMLKVNQTAKTDPEYALKLVHSEMKDITMLNNVGKTEMDIHSLNATDEARALRKSNYGADAQYALYGLYERIFIQLKQAVKKMNKQNNVVKDLLEEFDQSSIEEYEKNN
ncbi:MAG: hypothetical protein UMR38_06785 [Candidatus Izemoplasma sp.]|nr:hypothetical protein [Candidatus Izemoplasma sp.]